MWLISSLSKRAKVILGAVTFFLVIFGVYVLYGVIVNTRLTMTSYVPTGHYPTYPAIDVKGKTSEQIIEIKRGEYLVKAGDCLACHTSASTGGKQFAGGLPMQTPFGNIYTPNITPDKETGIGKWSDQDFLQALHDGVRPDGSYYFPAFPYLYFNRLTTPDVLSIKAYLDSIPPVSQENRKNEMIYPFNWRFLQLGWRILFFYPERMGEFKQNPQMSKEWNRGAYLVQGLGHCSMCHTPSYYLITEDVSLGAPIRKYDLTGAVIEGYLAPNISKSNIGAIPDAQLMSVFRNYSMIGGNPVQGPMSEAIHNSLSYLTTEDLLTIITYLKTVDSKVPEEDSAGATDTGRVIYNNYCSACHNSGVGGAPRVSDAESWGTLANSGMEKLYTVAINGGGNMPAKGTCITCSDFQVRLAVDYMVARSKQAHSSTKKTSIKKAP